MNPKNYRPFPQYPITKDTHIAFVRFIRGGDGVPGQWKTSSGMFESDDGQIMSNPSDIVEWRPLAALPPAYVPVNITAAFESDGVTLDYSWTGGTAGQATVEESSDGSTVDGTYALYATNPNSWPVPDTGAFYRVRVTDAGHDDVVTDWIPN